MYKQIFSKWELKQIEKNLDSIFVEKENKENNQMDSDFILESIKSILRTALTPLAVLLMPYITTDQATQLVAIAASLIVAVGWGIVNKYLWTKERDVALELPANTTKEQLAKEMNLR